MPYVFAVLGVCLATLVTAAIRPWAPSLSLLFFPAIVLPATYGGYGPALLATVLSTTSLAYVFVPPPFSFSIGLGDFIRLSVFATVAVMTAAISSARKRAEDELRRSLADLQDVNATLRKVSEWPVAVGVDASETAREMLEHAAGIVGAVRALAIWEAQEEPWIYLADPTRIETISRHRPAELSSFVLQTLGEGVVAMPFTTEHLTGRVFFVGMKDRLDKMVPAMELVAREVSNSLDQLYLAEQISGLAVREERIRVARDLHDGVLQSLTGVRLQLQEIADEHSASPLKNHLLGIERAIATEQRELRLFIDNVRPQEPSTLEGDDLAQGLEEMRHRLGIEWKTPISIRVTPPTTCLPQATYRTLRLMIHEAVINALKHAHPSRVSVDVQAGDTKQVKILVANDGHGFPFTGRLEHDALTHSDAGPHSLRERVVALGGRMAVESGPSGACVEILLSLDT